MELGKKPGNFTPGRTVNDLGLFYRAVCAGSRHLLSTPGRSYFKTTPPGEVGIELTDAQLIALEDAYLHGFNNPEPNDPCKRLQMLPFKKLSAWRKQFCKRGFTMEKIKDMLANGRREAFTHPEKGVTYTRIFDRQGNWIVVDFMDCMVWQVAPYNFK
ncbi:MAG: hypothetical protein IPJ40_07740 [Saprospirales bacterium]|nr:hypothetical protein [Saprospirales bacterium]